MSGGLIYIYAVHSSMPYMPQSYKHEISMQSKLARGEKKRGIVRTMEIRTGLSYFRC